MIEFNFTLIMTWINFLVLFVVLRNFLFVPILEIQEKRKKHREAAKSQVSEGLKQVEALEKQYQERLLQARAESHETLHQARQEALSDKKRKKMEAEAGVARQIEEARVTAEKEIQAARQALPQRAALLASQIMEKILGRAVDAPVGEISSNGDSVK